MRKMQTYYLDKDLEIAHLSLVTDEFWKHTILLCIIYYSSLSASKYLLSTSPVVVFILCIYSP